jgi:hypothetical protein
LLGKQDLPLRIITQVNEDGTEQFSHRSSLLVLIPQPFPPKTSHSHSQTFSQKTSHTRYRSETDLHADMDRNTSDLYDLRVQKQRKNDNTATQLWTCPYCLEPTILSLPDELWKHTKENHYDKFPFDSSNLQQAWRDFENDCVAKRSVNMIRGLFPGKTVILK